MAEHDDDTVRPLIWQRVTPSGRGRAPSLTHDRIAEAAIAIARVDGLDAVTMRRVAADLGVGTMSLYRYVDGQSEIVELMIDAATGELGGALDGVAPGDWRGALRAIGTASRAMVLAHPWMTRHAVGARPSFGPNMLRWIERSTSALARPSLTMDQVLDLTGTITAFVVGYTQFELAEREEQRRSGLTEQQWRARIAPYMREVVEDGNHPTLRRIVIEAEDFPEHDEVFQRRLGYVIDGLGKGLRLR